MKYAIFANGVYQGAYEGKDEAEAIRSYQEDSGFPVAAWDGSTIGTDNEITAEPYDPETHGSEYA